MFGAYAQGRGENGPRRKAGALRDITQAIIDVLRELLQPNATPRLTRLFLYPRHIAELPQSRIARFLRRHPALDVVLRLALDMIANVLVELLQYPIATHHDSPPCFAGRRIREMAPANLSHLLVSSTSCRRPLRVNR